MPPILSGQRWVLAAVSKEDFLDSMVCGMCIKISIIDLKSRDEPESIYAAVVDTCNACNKGMSFLVDAVFPWYVEWRGNVAALLSRFRDASSITNLRTTNQDIVNPIYLCFDICNYLTDFLKGFPWAFAMLYHSVIKNNFFGEVGSMHRT